MSVQNDVEESSILGELKISASELGLWHDKIILSYHLTKFIDNSGDNKNLPDCLHLQKLILSENKKEAEKILNGLREKFKILFQNY